MVRRVITVLLLLLLLCCPPTYAEAKIVSDGLGNVYDDGLPEELPPDADVPAAVDREEPPQRDDEDEAADEEDIAPPQPIEPEDVIIPGEDEPEEEEEVPLPELALSYLEVEGFEFDRDFSPTRHRYNIYTTTDVTSVWVCAEAEYGRVSINSQRCTERSVTLTGESKDINILVEADGETVSYCITVHRVAAQAEHSLFLQIGHSFALLDGEPLKMDAPPEVVDDRTMVPLRLVVESLGAAVAWDAENRCVDMAYNGQLLKLYVGRITEGLDVAPYIKNDRTMVPLRYIMETFGADVAWNAAEKSITITFVEGE